MNIVEMNVSKAFEILKCNTLTKKWNYKQQADKLLSVANQSSTINESEETLNARIFLDTYNEKLKIIGYQTIKVTVVWTIFIFLKSFLINKRKKKTENKESLEENLQILTKKKNKNFEIIINSLLFSISEIFLFWWILSLQKI